MPIMRYYKLPFIILFLSVFVSCIKSEPANAEADITACIVDGDILKKDPIIQNKRIQLFVKSDTDLSNQAPEFELTPGASISPESGTSRNFTTSKTYTVISEDGGSVKEYEVAYTISALGSEYNFEHVRLENDKYDVFYEVDGEGKTVMDWASGNVGFSIVGGNASPDEYPTSRLLNGKDGQGAKLTTRSTGTFGVQIGKPIAAGNLFMGEFDLANSITDPLKSLKLGVPIDFIPSALKGFYKYEAGPVYTNIDNEEEDQEDSWDVYAIFFETDEDLKFLDGTNRFTHPNIVSIARIPESERVEADEWTSFFIPFELVDGKQIDPQKLNDGKYSLTLVFTSSISGDLFSGAVGSTLLIDEVELIHADDD